MALMPASAVLVCQPSYPNMMHATQITPAWFQPRPAVFKINMKQPKQLRRSVRTMLMTIDVVINLGHAQRWGWMG